MPELCIIPARALEIPGLSGSDLRVLLAIGRFTNGRTGKNCYAKSATLVELAGVSRSGFFASAERLCAVGLIRRESGKLAGRHSTYSIILDTPMGVQPDRHPSVQPDREESPAAWMPESGALDGPTINALRNDLHNAPTTAGSVADLRTKGEKLFAEILRAKRTTQTPSGPRSHIPKEAVEALSDSAKKAFETIGGTGAVVSADETGLRVLRLNFGRHYAAEVQSTWAPATA